MGYFLHHVIAVVGDYQTLVDARMFAEGTGAQLTAISQTGMNNICSFFVVPDGSKEGREASNRGDQRRAKIIGYLREQGLMFAEIAMPEDGEARIESAWRRDPPELENF
jgi:hypothetical protein